MPISEACLGGALNHLSSRTLKQWSLASSAGPDFFLDSPPASCGTVAPFRLCSHSQPQSSPWDLTSEAWASAPSPHLPRPVSRQASQAGECCSAPILCAGISPLCSLHPCCYALLAVFEAYPPSTHFLHQWGGFLVCGIFSSFIAPSQRSKSHPCSFVSVFSFLFCPTHVRGDFLAFWEVWGLLPVFSRCSVGVVPCIDEFLMYLWGGRWSPLLTPLPSSRSPHLFLSILNNKNMERHANVSHYNPLYVLILWYFASYFWCLMISGQKDCNYSIFLWHLCQYKLSLLSYLILLPWIIFSLSLNFSLFYIWLCSCIYLIYFYLFLMFNLCVSFVLYGSLKSIMRLKLVILIQILFNF